MNEHPKPICERIAAKLKTLREEAGLTYSELARRTELSRAYLWQLEHGESEPGAGTIVRLCRVLKVSADEFLGIESEKGYWKIDRCECGQKFAYCSFEPQAVPCQRCGKATKPYFVAMAMPLAGLEMPVVDKGWSGVD